MNIYQIDEALLSLVDQETGEIADYETFEALQMDRQKKIESVGCWIVNLTAEMKALKDREDVLKSRREADSKQIESLKNYLDYALNGEKFKTENVAISYRKSESVETIENFVDVAEDRFVRTTVKKEPDKTAIKEAIKNGEEIAGATIVTKNNISVK